MIYWDDDAQEYGRYLYHSESKRDPNKVIARARAEGCPERRLAEVVAGWRRERNDMTLCDCPDVCHE